MTKPAHGEVWMVQFAEPDDASDGKLPALVVSCDAFNSLNPTTVVVAPMVQRGFDLPCRIPVNGAGLKLDGQWRVACDLIRAVQADRLKENFGQVGHPTLEQAETAIAYLLGLKPKTAPRRGW